MNAQPPDHGERVDRSRDERREFFSYVWGAGLALVLTLVPFFVVHRHALPRPAVYYLIGVLAVGQAIIHFRFFLHIGFRQRREDLQLILFSALLLVILVGGTLWIMGSLATRMVLAPP